MNFCKAVFGTEIRIFPDSHSNKNFNFSMTYSIPIFLIFKNQSCYEYSAKFEKSLRSNENYYFRTRYAFLFSYLKSYLKGFLESDGWQFPSNTHEKADESFLEKVTKYWITMRNLLIWFFSNKVLIIIAVKCCFY